MFGTTNDVGPVNLTPASQAQAKREALRRLLQYAGAGVGVGVGLRGLRGAIQPTPADVMGDQSTVVSGLAGVPARRKKQADISQTLENWAGKAQNAVSDGWHGIKDTAGAAFETAAQKLPNTHTVNPLNNTWGVPATGAALAGGMGGGYALLDQLYKKQRAYQEQKRLEQAEAEYQQALQEQYASAMQDKSACAIDDLYAMRHALLEKTATVPTQSKVADVLGYNNWEALKGLGAGALLGAGAYATTASYEHAKKQQKTKLLEKAIKLRRQQQYSAAPPPIFASVDESPTA